MSKQERAEARPCLFAPGASTYLRSAAPPSPTMAKAAQ